MHGWARRVLEHQSSRLAKSIELSLVDVTCYDLELVARCCSHVEVLAASGVSVRSFSGLFWHMLEHGGLEEGFHELATPNLEEHEEQLRQLAAPSLPRRREKSDTFDAYAEDPEKTIKPVKKLSLDEWLAREKREGRL